MIEQFRTAMSAAGLDTSAPLVPDGELHRVSVEGDRRGSRNGWYVLHTDGVPAGAFGSWRSGLHETWCARTEGMSTVERAQFGERIEAARKQRDAERQRARERAAEKAERLWRDARPADPAHP